MRYVLALAAAMLTAAGCAVRQPPLAVPAGRAPHIDGNLDPEEWHGALITVLPDSTTVHLLHAGGHLYVGLDLIHPGVGSLCVAAGEVVTILHASAALGTARYQRVGETWQLLQPFVYTLRETDDTEATRRKRAEYLAEHGWVASTVGMGGAEGTLEYRISADLLGGRRPVLGVAALGHGESLGVTVWPRGLDDDCGRLELVRGETPEGLRFDPSVWLPLALR